MWYSHEIEGKLKYREVPWGGGAGSGPLELSDIPEEHYGSMKYKLGNQYFESYYFKKDHTLRQDCKPFLTYQVINPSNPFSYLPIDSMSTIEIISWEWRSVNGMIPMPKSMCA